MRSPAACSTTTCGGIEGVNDIITPVLAKQLDSELWLIGLGAGQKRMGGSVLAQCFNAFGGACPDLDEPQRLNLGRMVFMGSPYTDSFAAHQLCRRRPHQDEKLRKIIRRCADAGLS